MCLRLHVAPAECDPVTIQSPRELSIEKLPQKRETLCAFMYVCLYVCRKKESLRRIKECLLRSDAFSLSNSGFTIFPY